MKLAILLFCATAALADDAAVIRGHILKGADAFMKGDPDAIMAHYAPDIVLSYPGIPDQDYATLAKAYAQIRNRKPGVTVHTTPTFEEILVDGNLAIVRVQWTTTITDPDPARTTKRRLKDLQVWRREKDGAWRFIRGVHYPVQ